MKAWSESKLTLRTPRTWPRSFIEKFFTSPRFNQLYNTGLETAANWQACATVIHSDEVTSSPSICLFFGDMCELNTAPYFFGASTPASKMAFAVELSLQITIFPVRTSLQHTPQNAFFRKVAEAI